LVPAWPQTMAPERLQSPARQRIPKQVGFCAWFLPVTTALAAPCWDQTDVFVAGRVSPLLTTWLSNI